MILLPPNSPNEEKQLKSFQGRPCSHMNHLWGLCPLFWAAVVAYGLTENHRAPVPASTLTVCLPFGTGASLRKAMASCCLRLSAMYLAHPGCLILWNEGGGVAMISNLESLIPRC